MFEAVWTGYKLNIILKRKFILENYNLNEIYTESLYLNECLYWNFIFKWMFILQNYNLNKIYTRILYLNVYL